MVHHQLQVSAETAQGNSIAQESPSTTLHNGLLQQGEDIIILEGFTTTEKPLPGPEGVANATSQLPQQDTAGVLQDVTADHARMLQVVRAAAEEAIKACRTLLYHMLGHRSNGTCLIVEVQGAEFISIYTACIMPTSCKGWHFFMALVNSHIILW